MRRVNKVSEDELEEIRKRKLLALQQKVAEEQQQAQMEQQIETQKQVLLRKILTPEARRRLANLKMVKPDFTNQLELQLIQLAQQGKLPIPLTDEQLKQILVQLQTQKRETKIRRR
jgi:programmed cell death protein 5